MDVVFARRPGLRTVALLLAVGLLGASCSTVPSPLELAAGELSSSAASAELVVREHEDGRLTRPVAATGLDDAVRDVAAASRSLVELKLGPGAESQTRDRLVDAAAELSRALHRASLHVSASQPVDVDLERLARLRAMLRSLERSAARP